MFDEDEALTLYYTGDLGDSYDEEVRDKARTLRWITLGIGLSFLLISGINLLFFIKYKKMETIQAKYNQMGRSAGLL